MGSVSRAGLEWLFPCSASGMLLDSSCLVRSPFGAVSLASTAVPSDAFVAAPSPLDGRVARAPSGVPGVVAEDEGAEEEGAADEGAGAAAGADEAGAPPDGVEVAGADEAGAGGAVSGASARLQPAIRTAPSSDAAIKGARNGRTVARREEKGMAGAFMIGPLKVIQSGKRQLEETRS